MNNEIDVLVVNDPDVVAVAQPDLHTVTETIEYPLVIESPTVEVVTVEEDVHVVDEVKDIQVVTIGEAGPRGATGAAGPPGSGAQANFAYGDATPAPLVTATAGKVVYSVEVVITEPFDGVGAAITVGDAGQVDRLMSVDENAVTSIGSNTTAPAYSYGADTPITLSITPGAGASQGRGIVIVRIQS